MKKSMYAAGIALAAVVALAGCTSSEVRGEDGTITEGGSTDVFSLVVGDCLAETSGDSVTEVPTVPCSELHDYEVFYDFEIPGSEYPGDTAVGDAADEGCYGAYADFVGVAYEQSTLDFSSFVPSQASWEDGGDRLVSCVIYDVEQVTGTLAGSAR